MGKKSILVCLAGSVKVRSPPISRRIVPRSPAGDSLKPAGRSPPTGYLYFQPRIPLAFPGSFFATIYFQPHGPLRFRFVLHSFSVRFSTNPLFSVNLSLRFLKIRILCTPIPCFVLLRIIMSHGYNGLTRSKGVNRAGIATGINSLLFRRALCETFAKVYTCSLLRSGFEVKKIRCSHCGEAICKQSFVPCASCRISHGGRKEEPEKRRYPGARICHARLSAAAGAGESPEGPAEKAIQRKCQVGHRRQQRHDGNHGHNRMHSRKPRDGGGQSIFHKAEGRSAERLRARFERRSQGRLDAV